METSVLIEIPVVYIGVLKGYGDILRRTKHMLAYSKKINVMTGQVIIMVP